ncbi:hypothetical protein DdX_08220 [Ditylenchus destructor]|uniref:Uncharacterized protein n=1 Tax=Ditylenchus destructor TaxID=166010 RepID=A0AAD4N8D5_9BILA|nr:hypothetical protein DdX_08220 [Ditylenchus destructor]
MERLNKAILRLTQLNETLKVAEREVQNAQCHLQAAVQYKNTLLEAIIEAQNEKQLVERELYEAEIKRMKEELLNKKSIGKSSIKRFFTAQKKAIMKKHETLPVLDETPAQNNKAKANLDRKKIVTFREDANLKLWEKHHELAPADPSSHCHLSTLQSRLRSTSLTDTPINYMHASVNDEMRVKSGDYEIQHVSQDYNYASMLFASQLLDGFLRNWFLDFMKYRSGDNDEEEDKIFVVNDVNDINDSSNSKISDKPLCHWRLPKKLELFNPEAAMFLYKANQKFSPLLFSKENTSSMLRDEVVAIIEEFEALSEEAKENLKTAFPNAFQDQKLQDLASKIRKLAVTQRSETQIRNTPKH